jgi:hypothetical protein
MKTASTKKNIVEQPTKVEVVLTNFDVEKLAVRLARIMPNIVSNIIQREYSRKL